VKPAQPATEPTGGTEGAEPAPGKKGSYLPLIVALNVVLLAAIGLVLFFVLRGKH
jgi:hypothetical protein